MLYGISKAFEALSCLIKKFFLKVKYGKRISFGKKIKFRKGFRINVGKNAFLSIGDGTFFNAFCSINCRGKVIIGKNNIFGEYVTLYDHNHVFNTLMFDKKELKIGTVSIGDENWICTKSNICSNSRIGNRCVISAGTNYNNKTSKDYVIYKGSIEEPIIIRKNNEQ